MKRKFVLKWLHLVFVFLTATVSLGKSDELASGNKGKIFFYWGWNRAYYTKSDIHFKGADYDFTLHHVTARDRQTPFSADVYLNPFKLTIPQTNFKIGYYFWEKYYVSFGFDHMKYVMDNGQTVIIDGYIKTTNPDYNKTFEDEPIVLKKSFLEYEHTDGLNYVNVEMGRVDQLYEAFNKKIQLNVIEGFGTGFMYPRSDVHFLHYKRNNEFHITGFGTSLKAGLNLVLFKWFTILSEAKVGYINMPFVHPTDQSGDRAKQSFFFFQHNILFGGVILL